METNASGKAWEQASAQVFDGWKQSCESSLQALIELQKALAEAKSPLDLCMLQGKWMAENMQKSFGYWMNLFQAATESNQRMLESMTGQALGGEPASKNALVGMIEGAYAEWLRSSRRIMEQSGTAFCALPQRSGEKPAQKKNA